MNENFIMIYVFPISHCIALSNTYLNKKKSTLKTGTISVQLGKRDAMLNNGTYGLPSLGAWYYFIR